MKLFYTILALAVGYLLGSISFARLVTKRVAPHADISTFEEEVPHTDLVFVSDSVSATAVRVHVGTRYGCLTAALDMLKVAVPTLAFKLWQPKMPYYLVVAAAGVIGHDWPLYHRFKGGRGESPIYGGLLVVDGIGVLVTNGVGFLLGIASGNLLVLRWAGLVLTIPWFWLRTRRWATLIYAVVINLAYWIAMVPELKQALALTSQGDFPSQEELADFLGMGGQLGRFLDRYSGPALLAKVRGGSTPS